MKGERRGIKEFRAPAKKAVVAVDSDLEEGQTAEVPVTPSKRGRPGKAASKAVQSKTVKAVPKGNFGIDENRTGGK